MRSSGVAAAVLAALLAFLPASAAAQEAATPAPAGAGSELPPVEVIQKQATPAPAAQKKAAPKKKAAVSPTPQPPTFVSEEAATAAEPYFGAPGGQAAAARATTGPSAPINPLNGILPGSLDGFPSAGTAITSSDITEFQPRTTNDIFDRVPGVHVVHDDGNSRHGGIGIRGSPPRRGRKVLVMEDGASINMSLWLDPSVHYVPPPDRIDTVEVLRGTILNYGPNNNHGVVNFKNISPFGPNETVISGSVGYTENDDGFFVDDDDDELMTSIGRSSTSGTWHMHTRQMSGNVGAVFSYSGADVAGAWDTERLRYNDFYGALGWKGIDQDFTLSAVYFRQRDHYDESNLEGEEDGDFDESADGLFPTVAHCKSCYNPGSLFNTYNADVVRLQALHNLYIDKDTTLTSRVYGQYHRRDRYQNFAGDNPAEFTDGLVSEADDDELLIPRGTMLGRLRTYKHVGVESRLELANRALAGAMTQDIQLGARYEHHRFTNRNFFGDQGEILTDGDTEGTDAFHRVYEADTFSAFLQTAVHVARDFTVTPGLRLEHYRVDRKTFVLSEEEGEVEEDDLVDCQGVDEGCYEFELVEPDDITASESYTKTNVLPGVSFAYTGLYRTTLYGGYHRGLTMHVLREEAFPAKDEIGDNFQIGFRSTALLGVTLDAAVFHNRIQDFQIKGSGIDAVGNNIYSTVERVEINGFEMYGRLDTQPYIGGKLNPFFEGVYTFSDGIIKEGVNDDGDSLAGFKVPEVPRHVANLTVGMEHAAGWDMSVSWAYRGEFFTDEENTYFDQEGEDGLVPSVWLLSARANYRIPGTQTTLFVAGENLTDELYISDREDGVKPGQGRTYWTGFKMKLQ